MIQMGVINKMLEILSNEKRFNLAFLEKIIGLIEFDEGKSNNIGNETSRRG